MHQRRRTRLSSLQLPIYPVVIGKRLCLDDLTHSVLPLLHPNLTDPIGPQGLTLRLNMTPTLPLRIFSPEIEVVRKRMLSLRIVSFGRLERDFGLQKSTGEESERELDTIYTQPLQLVLHYSRVWPWEGMLVRSGSLGSHDS